MRSLFEIPFILEAKTFEELQEKMVETNMKTSSFNQYTVHKDKNGWWCSYEKDIRKEAKMQEKVDGRTGR